MNHGIYRLVFNHRRGVWMAVAEWVRGQGKDAGGRRRRRALRRQGVALALLAASFGAAALPRLPAGTVPVAVNAGGAGFVTLGAASLGAVIPTPGGNALTITQTSQKAVLNWQSFNVAAGSSVNFSHPDASASTLNRIGSADPSVIQGRIASTARDTGGVGGSIYLVNRNGILFDRGSQVNVGGLVASALDLSDDIYANGLLSGAQGTETGKAASVFNWAGSAEQFQSSFVRVEAGAEISTGQEGRVMLLAPTVENFGSIATPQGQTILAAGAKVYLAAPVSGARLRGFLVEVDPFVGSDAAGNAVTIAGQVTNRQRTATELGVEAGEINDALRDNGARGEAPLSVEELHARVGRIVAERGNVTLAALAVNQSGLVRATTSVDLNGSIYLQARDTVAPGALQVASDGSAVFNPLATRMGTLSFGAGSRTEVSPDPGNARTLRDDQAFNKSEIQASGKTIVVGTGAAVVARAGEISLAAQGDLSDASDTFGSVPDPAARVSLEAGSQIDASGLRDVDLPVERNVIEVELRGNEFKDSPLQRTGILAGQKVLIDVRTGTPIADVSGYVAGVQRGISEKSTAGGNIVLKSEGDVVVRADAQLDVSGGSIAWRGGDTGTTRLFSGSQSFSIGTAPSERTYDDFVRDTYRYEAGYVEGKDAGSVEVYGNKVALDGTLAGNTVAGIHQRDVGKQPRGGRLVVGQLNLLADGTAVIGSMTSGVRFTNGGAVLPAGFAAGEALPDAPMHLDAGFFGAGGFTRLQLLSAGEVVVPAAVRVVAGAGGDLSITGGRVDVQGALVSPGGNVSVSAASANLAGAALTVGGAALISTAGTWVSDGGGLLTGAGSDPLVLKGGSIRLSSSTGLTLASGSRVDVSGGGWLQANGRYRFGDAGSITLGTGALSASGRPDAALVLDGSLEAYGLSDGSVAGRGGSLSITASSVRIGGLPSGRAGEFHLTEDFFSQGGFRNYAISARDDLTVVASTRVRPVQESRVMRVVRRGGAAAWTAGPGLLPEWTRSPGTLRLAALSVDFGDLQIGTGAHLAVDPGGSVALSAGKSMHVDGTVEAAGGVIALSQLAPGNADQFLADRAIWLGTNARLLARGYARLTPNATGLRVGEVVDGGRIDIDATRGYLVSEAGALLDVSGSEATLDLAGPADGPSARGATRVGSAGGRIELAAREGMLLDGDLRAAGGNGALGGTLEAVFDGGTTLWQTFDPVLGALINGPRRLVLVQSHDAGTAALAFGDALDTATRNGVATLAADRIEAGGFSEVVLNAENRIEIDGVVSLRAQRRIALDAPNLKATGGAAATLNAGIVELANRDGNRQSVFYREDAVGGKATLDVHARHIVLEGTVTQQGFATTTLDSTGDIALRGVVTQRTVSDAEGNETRVTDYKGAFISGGDITLNARRIHPGTLSDFAVEIHNNADGTIRTGRPAGLTGGGEVLSAGGRLAFAAPHIEHAGVVKAPLGTIEMSSRSITRTTVRPSNAAPTATETRSELTGGSVRLADGSVTSVSAEEQTIPFGKTDLSGKDWVYDLGSATRTVGLAPAKRVLLDGDVVDKAPGAVVDLAGGGDLLAWEFLPGTGGSKDVLDAANAAQTYAILPGLDGAYAPFDLQQWSGATGVGRGEILRLDTAAGGLAAGNYVLLPARYALLPGAYTVRFLGARDALDGQVQALPGGVFQVAATRAVETLSGPVAAQRSERVEIAAGDVARTRSEYIETTANAHFAGGPSRLPGDAGQLAIRAGQDLRLAGGLNTSFAAGHRGAEVDVVADKLAVVAGEGTAYGNGFMSISAERLNALGAASLMIGGIRERDAAGTRLVVGASEVVVDNAGRTLAAPDIVLAATDTVTLADGAGIDAAGGAAAEDLRVAGDGALLRVSGKGLAGLERSGTTRGAGKLVVGDGATLRGEAVTLDATRNSSFGGRFGQADDGSDVVRALALGAERISLGDVPEGASGLALDNARLASLGAIDTLRLKSYTTVDLYGGVSFGDTLTTLDVQGAGIAGVANAGQVATLSANKVRMSNVDGIDFDANAPATPGTGTLRVEARETLTIGRGDFKVAGFSDATLQAGGEIVASGAGSHSHAGNLTLSAGRIGAGSGARQRIAAAGALVTAAVPPVATLAPATPGGQLVLSGSSIAHGGRIDAAAGKITLVAIDGDLELLAGSQLNAQGHAQAFADTTVFAAGGEVRLESRNGSVRQDAAAAIDVSGAAGSAGEGGDAGSLVVAAAGTADLAGTVNSRAGSGSAKGGRFGLDAGTVGDLGALAARLAADGFDERIAVRARSGDLGLVGGAALVAHEVELAADDGNLTVAGRIDASGAKGGQIRLFANRGDTAGTGRLTLASTARLDASATEAIAAVDGTRGQGGDVVIGVSAKDPTHAEQAQLRLLAGSEIDVAAAPGSAARGGSVAYRAPRVGPAEVAMTGASDGSLAALGTVAVGAASVAVEAVRVYDTSGNLTIDAARLATWRTDTSAYMANAAALKTRLFGADASPHLRAGIEARAAGNITLATDWDFQRRTSGASDWRSQSGSEPGFLTLRAGGNLNLNASLSDGFASALVSAAMAPVQDAWSFRVAAGADLTAANPLTLASSQSLAGAGDLTIAASKLVRTGRASIDLAAGGDIVGLADAVVYTAGAPGAVIPAAEFAVIHPSINPSFPADGGDLNLLAQGDISFVRGTQFLVQWLYRQGRLQADGTLGNTSNGAANNTAWWVNFSQFRQGIGALGGGDVTATAGNNISGLSVSAPNNGRLTGAKGSVPLASNLVLQGGGDVVVRAGGDVTAGMFYAANGRLDLSAGGTVGGEPADQAAVSLALGDSRVRVEAGGTLQVDKLIDPFLSAQATGNISGTGLTGNTNRITYFSGYGGDSAVQLTALSGDVSLGVGTIAPPSLRVASLDGSLRMTGGEFQMAPGPRGELGLFAGDSVLLDGVRLVMSDAPAGSLATPLRPQQVLAAATAIANLHSSPPLHGDDPEPVRVVALRGDIVGDSAANTLTLPKRVTIRAGGDIANLGLTGQNLGVGDVSRIEAGGDIVFESVRNLTGGLATNTKGIEWSGPGRLEMTAGGSIDLGSSRGVVTRGNLGNPFLPEGGAAVVLQAGARTADLAGFLEWIEAPAQARLRTEIGYTALGSAEARADFLGLPESRSRLNDLLFNVLRGVGRTAAVSEEKDYSAGYAAIDAMFPASAGPYQGNIDMFFSQIKTEQGGGIDLLAPGGLVNAGLAVSSGLSKGPSELGIVTARGGSVRAAVRDDFAVNQSRVFTLQGGDILIWSSDGDIDAGKGAKTAAATPPPQIIIRGDRIILDTSNSVGGSGIGVLLGKEGVAPGSVDLIAPRGTVIAGEAGIRATGDIVIPGKVSGADNIAAGGSKIGVPQVEVAAAPPPPPPPPPADTAKAAEQAVATSAGISQRESGASAILTVEVIGTGEEDEEKRIN